MSGSKITMRITFGGTMTRIIPIGAGAIGIRREATETQVNEMVL